MKKRALSILLVMALIVLSMPTTVIAADEPVQIVETGVKYSNIQTAIENASSGQTVKLIADVTENILIASGKTVNLDLNGHVLKGTGSASVITINSGATLTLQDANTSEHFGHIDSSTHLWVKDSVKQASGNVSLYGGYIIGGVAQLANTGSKQAYIGGGVSINGGTFNMRGGNIAGCQVDKERHSFVNGGGGVGVYNKATFNMYSGTITGCYVTNSGTNIGGGAVLVSFDGTFNMYDDATLQYCSGGNNSYGGAVRLYDTGTNKMTMSGGTIKNCSSKGACGAIMSDGNSAYFEISGGLITGCNTEGYTGAVGVKNFTMTGGTISDNTAVTNAAAIHVKSKFTMSGGKITGNTTGELGAVYISAGATFTMTAGTISGNTVEKDGGGIYIASNSTSNGAFIMTGGSVEGNSATGSGGGVYNNGTISLGGKAKITNNKSGTTANNIYLPDSKHITIGTKSATSAGNGVDAPTGLLAGVITQTAPTDTTPVQITSNGASTDKKYFISDVETYKVRHDTDHLELYYHIHDPKIVSGKEPTEKESGWKDYYECECGEFFEDEAATVPIPDIDKWKEKGGKGYLAPLKSEIAITYTTRTETGDNSYMFLWLALLLISTGILMRITKFDKRKIELSNHKK